MNWKIDNKFLAEFVGTFALVFFGTGAVIIGETYPGTIDHLGIGIAFGLVVMVMIYTFGPISGAHINPAVSIGFACTNRFDRKRLIPYCIAQLLGAIAASAMLRFSFPANEFLGATLPSSTWQQAFLFEFVLAFILMFVILAVSQHADMSRYTAIAVGGIVGLEALVAGPVCGASMNPARSLAPALLSGHLEYLWVYIVSTIAGAICATLFWKKLFASKSQA